MALLSWSPTYSVGDADLDADHRRLVDLINALDDAVTSGDHARIAALVHEITDYAAWHLIREEEVLERAGYPEAESHADDHRRLELWLEEMRRDADWTRETKAPRLLTGLVDWFAHHVLQVDMRYKSHLEARRDGLL